MTKYSHPLQEGQATRLHQLLQASLVHLLAPKSDKQAIIFNILTRETWRVLLQATRWNFICLCVNLTPYNMEEFLQRDEACHESISKS